MIACTVEIRLGLPGGRGLESFNKEELAGGMDLEVGEFEAWFRKQGNSPLIGQERAILKTYFAWKTGCAQSKS
jgi:hypothetical protein